MQRQLDDVQLRLKLQNTTSFADFRKEFPVTLNMTELSFLHHPDWVTGFNLAGKDVNITQRPWKEPSLESVRSYLLSETRHRSAFWHSDKVRVRGWRIPDHALIQIHHWYNEMRDVALEQMAHNEILDQALKLAVWKLYKRDHPREFRWKKFLCWVDRIFLEDPYYPYRPRRWHLCKGYMPPRW